MKSSNLVKPFFFFITIISFGVLSAQDLDKSEVKNAVESKQFVFKARTAIPMTGSTRQLTNDFDLKLTGDSLISYLPYFGRAYTVPAPGEGGFDFTSTDFEYNAREGKKGRWEITITPKDTRDVRQMMFNISENGYASLQVTSNSRQSISFNGYIK